MSLGYPVLLSGRGSRQRDLCVRGISHESRLPPPDGLLAPGRGTSHAVMNTGTLSEHAGEPRPAVSLGPAVGRSG